MTPDHNRRRAVLRLAILAGVLLGCGLSDAAPVAAHARIASTTPADGGVIDALPERVEIVLDAKRATVEGDPLVVYSPDGQRVDDGDVRVEDGGRIVSVGLAPGAAAPAGRYEIIYRIVSADSHVITGSLDFELTTAGTGPAAPLGFARPRGGSGLRRAGPVDLRPEVLAVAAIAAMVAVAVRRSAVSPSRHRVTASQSRRRAGSSHRDGPRG